MSKSQRHDIHQGLPKGHVHIYKVCGPSKWLAESVEKGWAKAPDLRTRIQKIIKKSLLSMSLNLLPFPFTRQGLSRAPPFTDYYPGFCFFWKQIFPSSRYFSISPNLPFNISLPGSLSLLFIRYFMRNKCKRVIYVKGVYGWQWFNLFRWYSCFKRSFLEVGMSLSKIMKPTWWNGSQEGIGEWASSGPSVSFITTQRPLPTPCLSQGISNSISICSLYEGGPAAVTNRPKQYNGLNNWDTYFLL